MSEAASSPRGRPWRLRAAHWLILLGLTLPGAMLGLSLWMAWQHQWAQAENRAKQAAEGAAEYASRLLNTHILVTDRISEAARGVTEAEIRADEARWHRHLQGQIARLRLVLEAKLIGADGDVLAAATASPPPSANMATREHFTALASIPEGTPWISRVYERAGDSKRFFAVSRARHLPDAGVVALAIDQAAFGAGLARVAIGSGETVALMRRDGEVLVRYPVLPGALPRVPPNAPIRQFMAQGRDSGSFQANYPTTGEPILVAFRRLAEYPSLYAVTAMPRALIIRQWWQDIWHVLAFGLPAMLALGGLAWRAAQQQASLLAAKAELETRVAERTAQLADEGQRLALILEATQLGSWEMDMVRGTIWRSKRMREILGVPEGLTNTNYPGENPAIHPDDLPRLQANHRRVMSGEANDLHMELRFRAPSGEWRWMETFGRVVRRDPGTRTAQIFTGITRDITDRKEAEARRELMIRELDHRAKNILAVIQSIVRLSAKEDPARYAARVDGRIAALSRAQALLSAEAWSGAELASVLGGEVAACAGPEAEAPRFSLQGPPLRLAPQFVQPLTLAAHELASNARDHGAFTMPQGQVAIRWQVDDQAGLLRIFWQETGGPAALPPASWSVGGTLMRATIEKQLQGSFTPEWQEKGFSAIIALPLGRALGREAAG